jgi:hypothetical protein
LRIGSLDRRDQENWLFRAFGIFVIGLTLWILVALTLSSANAGPLSLLGDLSSKLKASYGIDLFGNSMGSLQLSIIEDVWRDSGGSPRNGDEPSGLVALIDGSPVPTATLSGEDAGEQPSQEPTHTLDLTATPSATPSPTFTATPTSSPTPTATEVSDSSGGDVDPSGTPSPTPSETPSPIPSKTPRPSKTPSPTPTKTPEPSKTPKPTHTSSPTPTKTPKPTKTPIPTWTPEPTETPWEPTPNDGTPSGPVTPVP